MKKCFVEIVTERIGDTVVASTVRPATKRDFLEAKRLHEQGKCPHTVVTDEYGWLYDVRSCAVCGKGLGTV